jgi:serine/threonine protein kinase
MAVDPVRAKSLFLAASELPNAAEQAAYLDRECGEEIELRARVEALLRADEAPPLPIDATGAFDPALATGEFVPDAATGTFGNHTRAPVVSSGSAPVALGTVIAGRYTLVETIGEGGMGSVYLSSQTEPVKRQVALKLIKTGMDSKVVLARFDAERQALAMMDHPNIARVYDGGTTPTGQPFFVMELVKGVPLTEYCDQHRLSVDARLLLFVSVCQAVQHAHQKGIIHRDLKPGNVLVTEVDGRPTPKVIDFGVAKATEQKLTDLSFSDVGAIVGTPSYMSPEQADPTSMDIDTRTDVYALGVMLYELLTGSPPIDSKRFKRGAILEILRMVREVEPPRPSTRLSEANARPNVAANRSIEPGKLAKLLQGELDWVVMKAIEKDRTRRYETANGLARDIQRYLSDEVVEARPTSTGYRLRKLVRRNKGRVLAAGLIAMTLVGGIIGTSLGLVEAKRQAAAAVSAQFAESERAVGEHQAKLEAVAKRAEAESAQTRAEKSEKLAENRLVEVEAEKKTAEREKQIARAVGDFLQNKLLSQGDARYQAEALLKSGGVSAEIRENPTIRELLDRAAKELEEDQIERNFPKQPLLQAELLKTMGDTFNGVGAYEQAIAFLERSAKLFVLHLGAEHLHTLNSLNNLATAYQAAGRHSEALELFAKLHDSQVKSLGAMHPKTLETLTNFAQAKQAAGKLSQAIEMFEKTLEDQVRTLGAEHQTTLITKGSLAGAYGEAGNIPKAIDLLESVHDAMVKTLGAGHPNTISAQGNLAFAYRAVGKFPQAFELFEKVRDAQVMRLGVDHPNTLITLTNLAMTYQSLGKLPEAAEMLERVYASWVKKLGADHPQTLTVQNNLAGLYLQRGQLNQAIELFEKTRDAQLKKQGAEHPNTLITMNNLAGAYQAAGKLPQAIELFEQVCAAQVKTLGADHPHTINTQFNLADAYRLAKRLPQAIELFQKTLDAQIKILGPDHASSIVTQNNLALAYQSSGMLQRAIELLEKALDSQVKKFGTNHPNTTTMLGNLGGMYCGAGQGDKAAAVLRRYIEVQRKRFPENSPAFAGVLSRVSVDLMKCSQYHSAEEMLREGLAIQEKTEPDAWTTFNTKSILGGALLGQKNYAAAERQLTEGYEGMLQRAKPITPQAANRLSASIDWIIELNTALNKPEGVAKWRAERRKYPLPQAPLPREKK